MAFDIKIWYFMGMKEIIQIDQAGRVVLPKPLRDSFRLKRGDKLAVVVRGDAIELRPTKSDVRLERVNGVLVLTGEFRISEGRDLVEEAREERIDALTREHKLP
jgi:AbrB family looped-hinge helix DNA binding protein